jgi:hypothetical protein
MGSYVNERQQAPRLRTEEELDKLWNYDYYRACMDLGVPMPAMTSSEFIGF